MKRLLPILVLCMLFNNLHAQDNCKVMPDAIKGSYTGDCKDGKAEGKGKAVGIDSYEGTFAKGYPDGQGKYIWSDGHYYIGGFRKGKLEGAGKMYFEAASGQDSVIAGFWKKDKYAGEYENSFEVDNKTTHVVKIDGRLEKRTQKGIINITTNAQSGALVSITSINVIKGQYISSNNSNLGNATVTRVQQIIFPFSAIFYLSNGGNFQMTFYEPGDYDVTVNVFR